VADATQSAVMRVPSVETEVNALRAEEEQAEAMAAYQHHLKPLGPWAGSLRLFRWCGRYAADAGLITQPTSPLTS
jgi:hypothetical protein